MAYITQQNLEDYLKRDLTAEEQANFTIIEETAKELIDNYTDTSFEEAIETSRYFDGGNQEVDIDPCSSVSSVLNVNNDESIITTYDDDEYVLEPRNKNIKNSIRFRFGKSSCGIKNIKVTAKFSSYDGGIPEAIKLASLKLCSDIVSNPLGFKRESIEGYSYDLGNSSVYDEVKRILAPYRQVIL